MLPGPFGFSTVTRSSSCVVTVSIRTIERQPVNIYVGNLPFSYNSGDLQRLFEAHGTVTSAQVLTDRDTGRSRGFGFVEMSSDDEARTAIQEIDGSDIDGRRVKVNEAKPRTERPARQRF